MYDADKDPAWFTYLARHGSLDWKPGQPEYEELMTRYQKEGVRSENKKAERKRKRSKQTAQEEGRWEVDGAFERHPLPSSSWSTTHG